jgi:hypothetical protein
VLPPDVKIEDLIKANGMTTDIMLEENDRLIICGSVSVMDHEKISMDFMLQMTPALGKKLTTLMQVTFAKPPLAINYQQHCYMFRSTSTCTEISADICSPDM